MYNLVFGETLTVEVLRAVAQHGTPGRTRVVMHTDPALWGQEGHSALASYAVLWSSEHEQIGHLKGTLVVLELRSRERSALRAQQGARSM